MQWGSLRRIKSRNSAYGELLTATQAASYAISSCSFYSTARTLTRARCCYGNPTRESLPSSSRTGLREEYCANGHRATATASQEETRNAPTAQDVELPQETPFGGSKDIADCGVRSTRRSSASGSPYAKPSARPSRSFSFSTASKALV